MADDRRLHTGEVIQSAALFLGFVLGYSLVFLRKNILPEYFNYDGMLIQRIAQGSAAADASYTNTANVYRFFGLQDNPTVAGLLGYSLAGIAIVIVWARCRSLRAGWGMVILATIAFALSAVYLGFYSKDVLVVPIVIVSLLLPPRWWSGPLIASMMLVYAQTFRSYWYFVIVLFIGIWIILPKLRVIWILVGGALATASASLAIYIVLGVPGNYFRSGVNEYRDDVGTLIQPFVSFSEPLGGMVNNVLTFFSLIFPWPVLAKGSPYYIAVSALIATLWLLFFRAMRNSTDRKPLVHRAAAIILAFLCTQSLFEPDYGSALRHMTPLLPLFLLIAWQAMSSRSVETSAKFHEPTPRVHNQAGAQ